MQRRKEVLYDGCPKLILVDGIGQTILRVDNIQHHVGPVHVRPVQQAY